METQRRLVACRKEEMSRRGSEALHNIIPYVSRLVAVKLFKEFCALHMQSFGLVEVCNFEILPVTEC
jgi:hypothetical protein